MDTDMEYLIRMVEWLVEREAERIVDEAVAPNWDDRGWGARRAAIDAEIAYLRRRD